MSSMGKEDQMGTSVKTVHKKLCLFIMSSFDFTFDTVLMSIRNNWNLELVYLDNENKKFFMSFHILLFILDRKGGIGGLYLFLKTS